MSAKILVADESPTIHKIVAMAFEEEGITVEGISRGEHALEYMAEFQPNIVLADIHLPGTGGYALCQQIKNSPAFESVRVILLTSDFEDIDKKEMEGSRADDFISKPFKTEEILKKVNSQLNVPEPEKEEPTKKAEIPQEPEINEVIQNEFEDIINQPKNSTSDTVKQLFPEDEEPNSFIDEIDVEPLPSEVKAETPIEETLQPAGESKEDQKPPQIAPKTDRALPEIILDLSEEAFRAETRPVKVDVADLNSAFQSALSSPKSGPEGIPRREAGSRPNLIEETLSFMAKHPSEKELEITLIPETGTKKESANTMDSADSSLANRIIQEHMGHIASQIPEDARHDSPSSFEKTVRNVLGEVAPKIIRQVIQEEIENIKKMKGA